MLATVVRYRRLVWQHAVAQLRHRYAGTGFGVVWNVLHPLAMIAIYSVVFSAIMPAKVPGVGGSFSYVLYLCAGFLPWLAFADCVTRATTAFTDNAAYLKKLPIPESVFVVQAAGAATLGLLISFSLLILLSLAAGLRPSVYWLLLPIPLLALQALGLGVGLLLGTLNAFFRDVSQFLNVGLQVAMWTAPIVYLSANLPAGLRAALAWHPIVPALNGIRMLFLDAAIPGLSTWILMFAWPTVAIVIASAVLGALRKEIRDVL